MGFTYGYAPCAARSGVADRTPDREEHNGADGGDDQIAPEIRHHFQMEFLEQEAADDGADEPDRKIVKDPARTAEDDLGQPARDQAHDDPTENAHRVSYKSFSVMPIPSMTVRVTYSTRGHKHRAPLPSSSPTVSDAGRWCASVLPQWSPNSLPPRSPESIR